MKDLKTPRQTAVGLVEPTPATLGRSMPRCVIGILVGLLEDDGTPLVRYPGQLGEAAIEARTTVDLYGDHVGGEVVLAFEDDDANGPIVIGRVRARGRRHGRKPTAVEVEVDGERLIVDASEQLVLQCGKASITLTRAGKVLITGTYVLSHSSGVNRVKGGSVQLN